MNLKINSDSFNNQIDVEGLINKSCITVFGKPIYNTKPSKVTSLLKVFKYIKSDAAKEATNNLRSIDPNDKKARSLYKAKAFDYVLFSGIFNNRSAEAMEQHSQLLCLDFDHLGDAEKVKEFKEKLIADPKLNPLLVFTSPSGDGIKCVVAIIGVEDTTTHKVCFDAISKYVKETYDVECDATSDVCRATYLPSDKNCYFNNSKTITYTDWLNEPVDDAPQLFGAASEPVEVASSYPAYENTSDYQDVDYNYVDFGEAQETIKGYVSMIIENKLDLFPTYYDQMVGCFSLQHGFYPNLEDGYELFHSLCKLWYKYTPTDEQIRKDWEHFLQYNKRLGKKNHPDIKFPTIIFMCKEKLAENGIDY